MGEDLYRLISTGLLGVIVLLLLLAVSQLGRLQRSLGAGHEPSVPEPSEPAPERTEADPVADELTAATETPAADEDTGTADVSEPTTPDEEGPFERDGRWWFRRDGDLLVYDEQLEEWVDPNAPVGAPEPSPAQEPEPVAVTAAPDVIEPHPLDEARDWDGQDTREAATETAPAVGTTPLEEASPAPIPEPVSAPAPITETTEGAQGEAGTHWKCPACGVINGSTASSCRMCFAARP